MTVLALGVTISKTAFTAATWLNGSGKLLGTFPNTAAGVQTFAQQLARIQRDQRAEDVHVVLEPKSGDELLLAQFADQQGWHISFPNPRHLHQWAKALGYREQTGNQGTLLRARYAAAQPLPVQQALPPEISELQRLLRLRDNLADSPQLQQKAPRARHLAVAGAGSQMTDVGLTASLDRVEVVDKEIQAHLEHYPIMQQHLRQLRAIAGINQRNALHILVWLHRWHVPTDAGEPDSSLAHVIGLQTQHAGAARSNATVRTMVVDALDTAHSGHPLQAFYAWLSALPTTLQGLRPLALVTIVAALALRLVDLNNLPNDLYGDIAIVIDYVTRIQQGQWPTSFTLSSGPLYHYLIMPVIWITGINYLGIKIASVLVSLAIIRGIYLLGRELVDDTLGLLAAFSAGVSSWLLIFSRLGNSQIVLPLITVGASYYLLRATHTRRRFDIAACALVSAFGLYTYPQNFILPVVSFITLVCLLWLGQGIRWRDIGFFCILSFVFALPFGVIVLRDPGNFFSGYIGDKLPSNNELLGVISTNIWHELLSLHVRGDNTFRSNPASLPHLDLLSGLLLLVGIVFWLRKERRRLSPVLLIPLVLLQAPAVLVRTTGEVPSASRTLGIVPFVFVLVASGLWWIMQATRSRSWLNRSVLPIALVVLLTLNSYRYFETYAQGLPNHNTAFGEVIADYIDQLPPQTNVYVIGCCWGDAGQPHPYAIQYAVTGPQILHQIPTDKATCAMLEQAPRPAKVIWNKEDALPAPQLAPCLGTSPPEKHLSPKGEVVFQSADLPPR